MLAASLALPALSLPASAAEETETAPVSQSEAVAAAAPPDASLSETPENEAQRLQAGESLLVETLHGKKWKGRLRDIREGHLTLESWKAAEDIPIDTIDRVWAARGSHARTGAIIGAVIGGLVIGAFYAALAAGSDVPAKTSTRVTKGAVLGGVMGGAMGAGTGCFLGNAAPRWERVYSAGSRNAFPVVVSPGDVAIEDGSTEPAEPALPTSETVPQEG